MEYVSHKTPVLLVPMKKTSSFLVRNMVPDDWEAVARIYAEGIATGMATFEQNVPSYTEWHKAHLEWCRLVATHKTLAIGWAALSPVSSRCVYGGVAEVSVYTAKDYRGKGIGRLLLRTLIAESEAKGIWTLQSGVFPENEGSIALHKKSGFRYIGKRERIGKLHGEWKDNLLFERRSDSIGVD